MPITPKPGCRIVFSMGQRQPGGYDAARPDVVVRATVNVSPLFIQVADSRWIEQPSPVNIERLSDGMGTGIITLPAYTDCRPQTTAPSTPIVWSLSFVADNFILAGVVTSAMVTASQAHPLTLQVLQDTYSWGFVNSVATPVTPVIGPAGPQGPAGQQGSAGSAGSLDDATLVAIRARTFLGL